MDPLVNQALRERIAQQDRIIAILQADLHRSRAGFADALLGQLRLRQAVLLYIGHDCDDLARQISNEFGEDVAEAVSKCLFVLDNAPIGDEAREAFRTATNHGMNRW